MRGVVIFVLFLSVLLAGCAQANDPVASNNGSNGPLHIDYTVPTVGDPYRLTVSDNIVYVAENQGGFSLINTLSGTLINRYYSYNNVVMRTKRIAAVPEVNRLYVLNATDSDGIMSLDTQRIDGVSCHTFIGSTSGIDEMYLYAMTPEYTQLANDDPLYGASSVVGLLLQDNAIKYSYFSTSDSLANETFFGLFSYSNSSFVFEDISMDNDYIYTAADQRGLVILQKNKATTNASQAVTLCGIADTPGEAQRVKVIGNYAYVVDVQGGLQVIDMSDHLNPECLSASAIATDSFTRSIDGDGNYLLVGTYGDGVYLFDISDPSAPVLKDHLSKSTVGYVNDIHAYGGKFYIASRDKGIIAVSIH